MGCDEFIFIIGYVIVVNQVFAAGCISVICFAYIRYLPYLPDTIFTYQSKTFVCDNYYILLAAVKSTIWPMI